MLPSSEIHSLAFLRHLTAKGCPGLVLGHKG